MVTADLLSDVKWRDGNGNDIEDEESGRGVYVEKKVVIGRTTRLTMRFRSLLTSQGGSYSCLSIIRVPSSIQVGARDVIVKSESAKSVPYFFKTLISYNWSLLFLPKKLSRWMHIHM